MIDIPHDLRWLGWLVGVDPPAGNEDALFAIGNAWNEAAKQLAAQVDPLVSVQRSATGAYHSGAGAETIAALFESLLHGDSSLSVLAADFDEIGNAAFDFGTTVQEAKLMMIISYALLAAEIAWAWMFPPTAPALEAAAVSGTRSSLRFLEDLTVEKIEQAILRASGTVGRQSWMKLFVKNLSTYAVKGMVSSTQAVILDAAVQGGQLAAHTRRHYNGNETLLSFGSSFLGGLMGRAAGHWGGIAFDRSIGRLTNGLGPAAGVFRGMAIGAFGGEVSTIGGAMGSALNSGDWQGAFSGNGFAAGMAGGAFRGSVAGGARGLFQLNRVPRGSSSTGFLRHYQVDAEGNVYTSATKAAAAGGSLADPGVARPAPVARPAFARSGGMTEEQQRQVRALDREDAANLRDYNRQLRERQPQLRAQPTEPVENRSRARAAGDGPPGDGPETPRPRARALGEPAGPESADRQPQWASRMSGRAGAMQERSDTAQRVADEAQTGADTAQGRATVRQTRATAEQHTAEQADAAVQRTQRGIDDARTQLTEQRAAAHPDATRIERAEQRVADARAAHTQAVREHAAAVDRAGEHQRRADGLQSRADDLQRRADSAQARADDLRMVRVSRDAINSKADGEARKISSPGADENTWWKRALMRSKRIGDEYGMGGEGTDRYQSKGTDLRGKTRAKIDKYHGPEIEPYVAPTAPDVTVWGTPLPPPVVPLPPPLTPPEPEEPEEPEPEEPDPEEPDPEEPEPEEPEPEEPEPEEPEPGHPHYRHPHRGLPPTRPPR
ncbi:hypothetical protein GFY24_18165 [Nocardia sp. SYP-A9097]|uniref:WXG100-like domain-containing protein n=1 Tax=Nocardia sp. SYP-A9097 TaxID=2663237 RepID=UPI00129A1060|nr:hypothetical protein [Nocardia sp. SYP-A9097]MRH89349.1 hypothetical protein [Nocardia sp. SYP-A9097]